MLEQTSTQLFNHSFPILDFFLSAFKLQIYLRNSLVFSIESTFKAELGVIKLVSLLLNCLKLLLYLIYFILLSGQFSFERFVLSFYLMPVNLFSFVSLSDMSLDFVISLCKLIVKQFL